MSYRLVAEVLDHAPPDLSPAERLVLVALAELMPSRKPWSVPTRVLTRRTGLGRGLRNALLRLAEHGCDVRVPIGKNKHGEPFYTVPGSSPRYMLPEFTAPAGCDCPLCTQPQVAEGGTRMPPPKPQVRKGGTRTASGGTRTASGAVTAAPAGTRVPPKPVRTRPAATAGAGADAPPAAAVAMSPNEEYIAARLAVAQGKGPQARAAAERAARRWKPPADEETA